MTTKEELQKQVNELQAKLDAMPDDKPKSAGRWKPELGGEYFLISGYGKIGEDVWQNSHGDDKAYALANVYRTQEEAQAALDQQLATVRVLDRIAELNAEQGWVCDWGDSYQSKNFIRFNHADEKLSSGWYSFLQNKPNPYYGSKQTIETVIKEMESDCLLMLGVSGVE